MAIDNLIRIMQMSIAPCVLISGAGLLLLSMVNRLSRPIDRIRLLCKELKAAPEKEQPVLKEQIAILFKRCVLLQVAIALATASIIGVSLLILILFSVFVFHLYLESTIEFFFSASLLCLILSLVFFLLDIRIALRSIKIEINRYIA